MRGVIERFRAESAENERIAESDLFGIENSFKAFKGRLEALLDPEVFNFKRKQESELRDYVNADPARKAKYGAAWDKIAQAEGDLPQSRNAVPVHGRPRQVFTKYFGYRARAGARRGRASTSPMANACANSPNRVCRASTQQLFSTAPVYPDYEKVKLGFSLTKMREWLGADNAFVRKVLGNESPQAAGRLRWCPARSSATLPCAKRCGKAAPTRSRNPTIRSSCSRATSMRDSRAIRKRMENEVESVIDKNSELIAAARFEKYGTSVYPDATFTERFSFGEVKGWEEKGTWIKPFTDIAGAFAHATGSEPFALPKSWLDAKPTLNMQQRFDFVTTNDIIGGNSGSPMINRNGEIVGLVFDGNIESLGGDFWFDERVNRTVAVHSGAILEALHKVYKADRLAKEIEGARKQ